MKKKKSAAKKAKKGKPRARVSKAKKAPRVSKSAGKGKGKGAVRKAAGKKKKAAAPKPAEVEETAPKKTVETGEETYAGTKTPKMTPLPPGNYMARVVNAEERESKTGRHMVVWDLQIIGLINDLEVLTPKFNGRHQFSWDVAEPRKGHYLRKNIETLGIHFTRWEDLPEMLEQAIGKHITIGIRGNYPRQATFFNRLIEEPPLFRETFSGGGAEEET